MRSDNRCRTIMIELISMYYFILFQSTLRQSLAACEEFILL